MKKTYLLFNTLIFATVAAPCLLASGWVYAQQSSSSMVIEEVIVTAEKREASIQESALAVTAISAEQLARQNIINIYKNLATTRLNFYC